MKIDLTILAEILRKKELEPGKMREIFEEINLILSADEDDKDPAIKKQHVILISDPLGILKGVEFVGWVLQVPEDVSPVVTEERILKAAHTHNATNKGQNHPVQSVGEALECISGAIFKEFEVWVKTKSPVQLLRTSNEIPNAPGLYRNGGSQ